METKIVLTKKLKIIGSTAVIFILILFSSCSSAAKKRNDSRAYGPEQPTVLTTDIPAPTESFGPSEPPPAEVVFGPSIQEKKKVNVVFTPGLARGFAAAGVLIAIEQAGVEIESIYGVEIPGMISALYGFSQNQNEFEWWIQKLNQSDFVSKNLFSGFFKRGKISSLKLEEKLKQNLKSKKDFSSARVFLNLCTDRQGGPLEQVSRVAKSESLYEAPTGCDSQIWKSPGGAEPKTIIVDLLGEPKAGFSKRDSELEEKYLRLYSLWKPQFEHAALILRPRLNDYDLLDFDRKTDIVFKGKESVEVEIEKIKELVK